MLQILTHEWKDRAENNLTWAAAPPTTTTGIGTLPPSPTTHLLLQREKTRNKEEVPKVCETPSETFTFPVLHRENGNFKIDTFRCKSEPKTFVPVTFPISFVLVMVCTSFSTLLFYSSKGEQIHVYRRYLFPVKTQFSAGKWLFFQTRPRTSLDMTAIHSTMMIKNPKYTRTTALWHT